MSEFEPPAGGFEWAGTSSDLNDEQFGDVVTRAAIEDADEYATVLVGEPYDGGVIGRQGAAEGPGAIREALAGVKTHHFETGPVESVGDLGDVVVPDASIDEVQSAVADVTARVHESSATPVFLGGGNSLTYPNVRPLLAEGSVGVVNFDAHLDVREVREDPTSGTPYRQLHEAGLDAYACVGARHFETSTAYADYVRENDGEVVTAEQVGDSAEAALDQTRDAMADVETVYVSVDLDVLDATAAPGVSAPTPGGLSARELFALVRSLAGDERVAGLGVVECAPPLDERGRTSAAGARTAAHFLAGLQTRL